MESESPAAKRTKSNDKLSAVVNKKSQSMSTSSKPVKKFEELKRKKPKPKPSTKITDLNEQCILEIMQRMQLADICTLSEVNVRFKELAQKYVRIKHHQLNVSLLVHTPDGKFSLQKLRQLLYNFGHLISTLTIDLSELHESDDCAKLFSLIRKYCFHTIDKLEFLNQPNDHIGEYIMCLLLGSEIMIRDCENGRFQTENILSFMSGMSIQTNKVIALNDN